MKNMKFDDKDKSEQSENSYDEEILMDNVEFDGLRPRNIDLLVAEKEVCSLSFMTSAQIHEVLDKEGIEEKDETFEYIQKLDKDAQYRMFLGLIDAKIALFYYYIDCSEKLSEMQKRVLKNIARIKDANGTMEFDVARKIVQRDGYYELAKYEKYFKNITREDFELLKDISDLKSLVNFDLKDKAQIKEEIDQIKKNGFKK